MPKPKTVFLESGFQFTFGEQWTILKYDDHKYYQIVSGRSFSGIDFAAILNDEELYLIEIKNFYQYDNKGHIEDIDQFVLEMREKVLDTIDLIQIIYKYHQRSWTYRILIKYLKHFPGLHFNWWFWTRMHDMITQNQFTFILLLDSVYNNDRLLSLIKKSIESEGYQIPNISIRSFEQSNLPGLSINSDNS